MTDCVLFASFISKKECLYIGKEFLDIFVEKFGDCDVYIGINPRYIDEWPNLIESYKNRLNIEYGFVEPELEIRSDASAYQKAMLLLKNSNKKYDIAWFGHTKGANRNDYAGILQRQMIREKFWNKRNEITDLFNSLKSSGCYGFETTVERNKGISNILDLYYDFPYTCVDIMYYYTFYAIRGEIIDKFIHNCKDSFFHEHLKDKFFFERHIPHIATKMGYVPLYGEVINHHPLDNFTKKDVENEIKIWRENNGIHSSI